MLEAAGAGKSWLNPSSHRKAIAAAIRFATRFGPSASMRFQVLTPNPARSATSR